MDLESNDSYNNNHNSHTNPNSNNYHPDPIKTGLYVLAAIDIFKLLNSPKYSHLEGFVSCFEIYGGKLFDLLNERGVVKCLEDSKQQVSLCLYHCFYFILNEN